jgi:hypothetical protein
MVRAVPLLEKTPRHVGIASKFRARKELFVVQNPDFYTGYKVGYESMED